jgi:hypothetical protein
MVEREGAKSGGGSEESVDRNRELFANVKALCAKQVNDEGFGLSQLDQNGLEAPEAFLYDDAETVQDQHFLVDEGGHVSRREVDDVETQGEGRRVEEVGLSWGSFGGDVEEADVETVVDDEAFG